MSLLNKLVKTTNRKKKRLGRGYGSGKGGHTASKGVKGQKSRVGAKVPLWFEGGQLPLVKRVPMMRGKARFKVVRPNAEISLDLLDNLDIDVITLEALKLKKVISKRFKKAKIINTGKLNRKLTIKGIKVSKGARVVIEKLGGKIEA
ncbi:MAG: 50S ribosomal protein L15 [Candidatus Woesebacteria bacterium]|jgi:large subunit ribosomal protein L15